MATEDRQSDIGLAAAGDSSGTAPAASHPHQWSDPPLDELLWSEPYRFEFFAALRVLARWLALQAPDDDDGVAFLEKVRFRALPSLSFPPSEIWSVTKPADDRQRAEMTVAFFGLTGPQGALPRPYTELLIERVRKKDYSLRDFLDLFNDRLLKLFAAAGQKYRFYLTYERAANVERRRRALGPQKLRGFLLEERPRIDLFSQVLLDLAGLGTPLLRYKDSVRTDPAPRLEIGDDVLRHYSGHLAQRHRNATSLRQLLAGYFGASIQVLQFAGQWVQLPVEYQTRLSPRGPALSAPGAAGTRTGPATIRTNATTFNVEPQATLPKATTPALPKLGENTVVGSRTWEAQGRFCVRVGPLTFEQFREYLPNGSQFRAMSQLIRLYVGPAFDFDLQPTLLGPEVPWCRLRAKGRAGPRLGWDTWIRNRPLQGVVDDAVFRVPDDVSMGN